MLRTSSTRRALLRRSGGPLAVVPFLRGFLDRPRLRCVFARPLGECQSEDGARRDSRRCWEYRREKESESEGQRIESCARLHTRVDVLYPFDFPVSHQASRKVSRANTIAYPSYQLLSFTPRKVFLCWTFSFVVDVNVIVRSLFISCTFLHFLHFKANVYIDL